MKKIFYFLIFSLSLSLNAQSDFSNLFDTYEKTKGITVIEIKKEMFDMIEGLDFSKSNLSDLNTILKDVSQIKIITFSDTKKSNKLIHIFNRTAHAKDYKTLFKSKSNEIEMVTKDDGTIASEFIIISDNSFILMEGNLKVLDLKKIIKK